MDIWKKLQGWYTQNGISTSPFFDGYSTEMARDHMMTDFTERMLEIEESLDAFGGWLIENKAPTSVLSKFREARKSR